MQVSIIAAVSADGFIARNAHQLTDWSSKEDKKVFVELTKRAGVLVMGGNTYRTIGRALPGRRNIVYSRSAIDQEGIETTQESPMELVARLAREGLSEVAICGGSAIYDLFLQSGLVTDVYLTIEPVLFGQGLPLAKTAVQQRLSLVEDKALSDNVRLLHYRTVQN